MANTDSSYLMSRLDYQYTRIYLQSCELTYWYTHSFVHLFIAALIHLGLPYMYTSLSPHIIFVSIYTRNSAAYLLRYLPIYSICLRNRIKTLTT